MSTEAGWRECRRTACPRETARGRRDDAARRVSAAWRICRAERRRCDTCCRGSASAKAGKSCASSGRTRFSTKRPGLTRVASGEVISLSPAIFGNCGGARVDGRDAGAAHLDERVAPHAGDLAAHPIAPADAVEMCPSRPGSAARRASCFRRRESEGFEESVVQGAGQFDVSEHRVGEFALARQVA